MLPAVARTSSPSRSHAHFRHHLRPRIAAAVDTIAANETVPTDRQIGRPTPYPSFLAFELLRDSATDDELRSLLAHPSPAVRCYTLVVLQGRGQLSYNDLTNAIADTARVIWGFGCIWPHGRVIDFIVENMIDRPDSELTWLPHDDLDAVRLRLITKYYYHWTVDDLLFHLPPFPTGHDPLRRLAHAGGTDGAIIALARYHRPDDLPFLRHELWERRHLDCGMEGAAPYAMVAAYPDSSFLPILEKIQREGIAEGAFNCAKANWFYYAVAAYDGLTALRFIEYSYQHLPPADVIEHEEMIYEAIHSKRERQFVSICRQIEEKFKALDLSWKLTVWEE